MARAHETEVTEIYTCSINIPSCFIFYCFLVGTVIILFLSSRALMSSIRSLIVTTMPIQPAQKRQCPWTSRWWILYCMVIYTPKHTIHESLVKPFLLHIYIYLTTCYHLFYYFIILLYCICYCTNHTCLLFEFFFYFHH